ncbi:MAG TPA: hypothetical protein VKE94_18820, partial [Gemmataceae bacterium]|nr:hypothetical protein [Gemmataceae bacterium]
MTSPSAQSPTGAQSTGSGSYSSATSNLSSSYSDTGSAAKSASGQTVGNDGAYYSQALVRGTAAEADSYYSTDYYSSEYYAEEVRALAAQRAELASESTAVRILLHDGTGEAEHPTNPPRPEVVTEIAPPAQVSPNPEIQAAAAAARPGDAEFIPAPHRAPAVTQLSAELLPADDVPRAAS